MSKHFDCGSNPPELAICWYLGKMLETGNFLEYFLKKYTDREISIIDADIKREYKIKNRRIDLCLFINKNEEKKYILAIEVKIHWPDENQLQEGLTLLKEENVNCEIFGLNFLSTLEEKQHIALKDYSWKYTILTMKDLLKDFCMSGIEYGHSIKLAGDLHQLLTYK